MTNSDSALQNSNGSPNRGAGSRDGGSGIWDPARSGSI